MTYTVGCTVRVPCRSNQPKDLFTRTAVVSTINEDDTGQKVASIILEDPTPRAFTANRLKHDNNGRFLIAPNFTVAQQNETYTDEEYDDVPLSSIQPLLPFELDDMPTEAPRRSTSPTERQTRAETQKGRGDALLRLRDPSAAVAYYEDALSFTSSIGLGGTVVVKRNGRLVLAEVDCIEDGCEGGDRSIDVTYVVDGTEGTVGETGVLLGVWEGPRGDETRDGSDRLQEKILLNLARCCLYLAEIDTRHGRSSIRSSRYRRSAILATSLAIACAEFIDDSAGSKMKARLLRARAYLGISKDGHAKADLQIVLREDSDCIDAKKMLSSLERARSVKKKTDRKLAKEMCTWIDAVTK